MAIYTEQVLKQYAYPKYPVIQRTLSNDHLSCIRSSTIQTEQNPLSTTRPGARLHYPPPQAPASAITDPLTGNHYSWCGEGARLQQRQENHWPVFDRQRLPTDVI